MHFFMYLIKWNCRLSSYQLAIWGASFRGEVDFQEVCLVAEMGRPLGAAGQDKPWQHKPMQARRPASLRSFTLKMSRELTCPFELFLILLCQHLLQKKHSSSAFFLLDLIVILISIRKRLYVLVAVLLEKENYN